MSFTTLMVDEDNISIIVETAPPSMAPPAKKKPKPKMHSMPKGKGKMPLPKRSKPIRKAFKSKSYFSPTLAGSQGVSSLRAKAGVDKIVRIQTSFRSMEPSLAPFICAEALGYYKEAGLVVKVSYGERPLEALSSGRFEVALIPYLEDARAALEGDAHLCIFGLLYPGKAPCGEVPLVTREDQLEERAVVFAKFMRATEEGAAFCADHPEWAVEIMRDYGLRCTSEDALRQLTACVKALDGQGTEPSIALAPDYKPA